MHAEKYVIITFMVLLSAHPVTALISQSNDPSYIFMATGLNYTAYFSDMNTNGFKFEINGHYFNFLPRSISYTGESGETTLHIGSAQDTQIKNTDDKIYFENAYGQGGELQYLSNPLMIKEVYVLNELPLPPNNRDWMTISSIAVFDNDLKLKYIDDGGNEKNWDGIKTKTNEIRFYDNYNSFLFEMPQPLAKDALENELPGHYFVQEIGGILYISERFPYPSLANMTLPIFLDLSLAEGEVAFGKSQYIVGETLDIWGRGFALSNERILLYNPSNQLVETFDWPSYADGWTSKYIYTADKTGSWKATLETKDWLWGDWIVQDTATANVNPASTPTPTPTPTPTITATSTPTPAPTTTPGPSALLYGYIFDTAGKRVFDTTVTIDTGQSSLNDYDYIMSVPSGMRMVTVSANGYMTQTKSVYVETGRFNRLDFTMEPKVVPTPTPLLLPDLSITSIDIFFEKVI